MLIKVLGQIKECMDGLQVCIHVHATNVAQLIWVIRDRGNVFLAHPQQMNELQD